jgi:hypothetical protein
MAKSVAKKAASKSKSAKPAAKKPKPRPAGKDKPMKYQDKSPGQPQLIPIFEQIKKLISAYVKPPMVERGDKGQYSVWNDKKIEVHGREREDVLFAGAVVQKGYVGFYFMPVYADPSLKSKLHPQLAKCLKGKSCFHIKKGDPETMEQVKEALKAGYDNYKKKGWI